MAPGDQSARLIRERDRRQLRVMGVTLLLSAALVGIVLGIVGLRESRVRLSYRLDRLRTSQAELEEANRQLRVELATLKALSRIEAKARIELGMVPPSGDQVRQAREYVAGVPGTAPLNTAWEERLGAAGP